MTRLSNAEVDLQQVALVPGSTHSLLLAGASDEPKFKRSNCEPETSSNAAAFCPAHSIQKSASDLAGHFS